MNTEKRETLLFILASIIVLGPFILGLVLYAMSGAGWALQCGFAWLWAVSIWAICTIGDE